MQVHTIGNVYSAREEKLLLTGFIFNGKEYALLVALSSGNRWDDPIEVKDFNRITQLEFKSMLGTMDDYKLIGKSEQLFF